jgi:hypothetical protein
VELGVKEHGRHNAIGLFALFGEAPFGAPENRHERNTVPGLRSRRNLAAFKRLDLLDRAL